MITIEILIIKKNLFQCSNSVAQFHICSAIQISCRIAMTELLFFSSFTNFIYIYICVILLPHINLLH